MLSVIVLPLAAEDQVDQATVRRIETEAEQQSQVMDTASWLTDVYGPRLTNSPGFRKAAEWAESDAGHL